MLFPWHALEPIAKKFCLISSSVPFPAVGPWGLGPCCGKKSRNSRVHRDSKTNASVSISGVDDKLESSASQYYLKFNIMLIFRWWILIERVLWSKNNNNNNTRLIRAVIRSYNCDLPICHRPSSQVPCWCFLCHIHTLCLRLFTLPAPIWLSPARLFILCHLCRAQARVREWRGASQWKVTRILCVLGVVLTALHPQLFTTAHLSINQINLVLPTPLNCHSLPSPL